MAASSATTSLQSRKFLDGLAPMEPRLRVLALVRINQERGVSATCIRRRRGSDLVPLLACPTVEFDLQQQARTARARSGKTGSRGSFGRWRTGRATKLYLVRTARVPRCEPVRVWTSRSLVGQAPACLPGHGDSIVPMCYAVFTTTLTVVARVDRSLPHADTADSIALLGA